jgi:hypothetical protein
VVQVYGAFDDENSNNEFKNSGSSMWFWWKHKCTNKVSNWDSNMCFW